MLKHQYYYIVNLLKHDGFNYPVFSTCAKTDKGYVRIADLKEYLANGTGLSDEVIENPTEGILISDHTWKNRF